jgi:hypothetical protein
MKRQKDDAQENRNVDTTSAAADQAQIDESDHKGLGASPAETTPVPPEGDPDDPMSSTRIDITPSTVIITIQSAAGTPTLTSSPDGTIIKIAQTRKVKATTRQSASHMPAIHVRIAENAFKKLRETVGALPAERGGIFVGPDPFCIEDFIFDRGSDFGRSVYYPNTAYLNDILERDHEPHGRRFVGLAHSHPNGYWHPSGDQNWGDVKAARNNLLAKDNSDLPALFIPIVESTATTGQFVLHPFVFLRRDMCVHAARFEVID